MISALTRRGLVSAAPAALIASTLPWDVALAGHPDTALLALRDPWLKTVTALNLALDKKAAIDKQIFRSSPEYPDWKSFEGTFEERSALCERITALRDAARTALGSDEIDRVVDEISEADVLIVDQVAAISARTLTGLAFKVEVSANWEHDRAELTDSIMEDILRLAKGELNG